MIRNPLVAGQFYPADPEELKAQIKSCFLSRLGPGQPSDTSKHIIGVISPHAGYSFSGFCQAWAYKELAESSFETAILLGFSHGGDNTSISLSDWKTPLGIAINDTEFQKKLQEISHIQTDEESHAYEHSIEVQIPFLQYIQKDMKIAPINVSSDINYKDTAKYLLDTIKKTKRKVIIVASSDFTHYGLNYGYMPFSKDVKNQMYKLDLEAIKFIEELDSSEFLNYIKKTAATICGKNPIVVLIELSKKLGAKKASLLKYYTSGDIIEDYSSAVGYAALKIV